MPAPSAPDSAMASSTDGKAKNTSIDAHEHRVDPAADIAGEDADARADDEGEDAPA